MNLVTFPTGYFPFPDTPLPIAAGTVYIGDPDTDPTVEANRKTVTLIEEDGTEVEILPAAQPLNLGMGGVFLYQNSPVRVMVTGNYSITVLDGEDVQQYYFPDAGIPDVVDVIQNSEYTYLTSVSGTNVITAAASPTPDDYVLGQIFHFIPVATNTSSVTLNISSMGAGAVQLGGAALSGDEIVLGVPVQVMVTSTAPTFEIIGNGAFLVADNSLESGTRALFMQNTAPTGWTFVSSNGDSVILNTDTVGEGGDTGGSWIIDSITVDGHAITIAEMPEHDHEVPGNFGTTINVGSVVTVLRTTGTIKSNTTGDGDPHDHDLTITGDWRPAYVKCITCQND